MAEPSKAWGAIQRILIGDGSTRSNNRVGLLVSLAFLIAFGFLALVAYVIRARGPVEGTSVAGIGVIIALACLIVGILIGFLFGIPRTLQGSRPTPVAPPPTPTALPTGTTLTATSSGGASSSAAVSTTTSSADETTYQENTNLEQISDWLTKILVGVGLTQLSQIPRVADWIRNHIAPAFALGNREFGEVFAMGLVGYFLVLGFLGGYLWTRMFMAGALREIQAGLEMRVQAAEIASRDAQQASEDLRKEVQDQATKDAKAIAVVNDQLRLAPGGTPMSKEDLIEILGSASAPVRAHVFNLAVDQRRANWQERKSPAATRNIRNTIPIFRALIAAEYQDYPPAHAQLAYALKDAVPGDYHEAEAELTTAITLRGSQPGWAIYELNRAECRIHQDANYANHQPAELSVKQHVIEDLISAARDEGADVLSEWEDIKEWMATNKVDPHSLLG